MPAFDLPNLADPGYTPARADLPRLVAAVGELDEERAETLGRALARAGEDAVRAALTALGSSTGTARERLFALLARLAASTRSPRLFVPLVTGLSEPSAGCRKAAARGLGHLGDARAEGPLLEALTRAAGSERRPIVEALGKVGGTEAAQALEALATERTLVPHVERALALVARRASRSASSVLDLERSFPEPQRVRARCRHGLAPVLLDEAHRFAPRLRDEATVELEHGGSLGDLFTLRTALDFGFAVRLPNTPRSDPAARIASALAAPRTVALLRTLVRGVPRVRLAWTSGGHHRALAWATARALVARTSAIVNDPRAAPLRVEVAPEARGTLVIVPEVRPDPRFAYRVRDVPAASHPTIAAALARLGGVRPDDVVWDPFVGSGLELVERARLGPFRRLCGSDLDPRALAAARENLAAAGISNAELLLDHACRAHPPGVTLILTNPPMGRRVARDGSLGALLEQFVRHAATVLVPGGRWVWLSPLDRRTERFARAAGLTVEAGPHVDIGGFTARIQVLRRPGA